MANHNNENGHGHEKAPIDTGHLSGQKRAKHNKTAAPHLTFTFQNAIKHNNLFFKSFISSISKSDSSSQMLKISRIFFSSIQKNDFVS